jgi:hypothetical protein
MTLDLALSYTPPGSELSMTVATVHDDRLLLAVLRAAIADAEKVAAVSANPVAAKGCHLKLAYLRSCLEDLLGHSTSPVCTVQ